jgi:hypothetical protein
MLLILMFLAGVALCFITDDGTDFTGEPRED